MEIAIVYNAPTLPPDHPDYASEAGVLESVKAMEGALQAAGHSVKDIECGHSVPLLASKLVAAEPDVVLNLCEGFAGRAGHEPHVAALFELLGLRYTGCTPECLSLTRDKHRTKMLLKGAGLPTADFVHVSAGQSPRHDERFELMLAEGPLLVKPAGEDASLGIGQESVVTTSNALAAQIKSVGDRFGDVLVEQYIDGREFNVGVVALPDKQALPVAEILFNTHDAMPWPIVTYDSKWTEASTDYKSTPVRCPADVEPQLARRMESIALEAFEITGCRDYARVDLRVSSRGEIFILEINGNPDAGPSAGLARALNCAGIDYAEFVYRLVATAASRGRDRLLAAQHSLERVPHSIAKPRPYQTNDREALLQILRDCRMFRDDEVTVAAEILDEAAQAGPTGHYQVLVAELEGRAAGWSCYGLVPMTDATYDLYWIAVDPKLQSHGIGRQLLREVERVISLAGGRWLIAETSSTSVYEGTRKFYLRAGFSVVSDLPDFYRKGDGKVTFARRLDGCS